MIDREKGRKTMKKALIACLLLALVCALTGCMRGGNADKGNDGIIGDLEDAGREAMDDVKDGLGDVKDNVDDKIDDIMPDNGDGVLPDVDDGLVDDGNVDGRGRIMPDPTVTDNVPNVAPYGNDGNTWNGNGTLNGSGSTANGGNAVDGNNAIPRGTIR